MTPLRLATWNVNGIRAAQGKGFSRWLARTRPDVVCLQETKAQPEQLDPELRTPKGYRALWHSAEKKGYSGVALFTRHEPREVKLGLGEKRFDREGRVLIAEMAGFTLINAYFPNSQRDHARLPYKLAFCKRMLAECEKRVGLGENVLLCGDFNIAHQEIDLANPRSNQDNAGFLPQERQWMTRFLGRGFRDTFRHFVKEGGHYTWWSQRPGVREKNIGWRLDTFVCNEALVGRLRGVTHQFKVRGSDHCPVVLELKR